MRSLVKSRQSNPFVNSTFNQRLSTERNAPMPSGGVSSIQSYKKGHLEWVMVTKNDQKTLKDLKRRFDFHPIDLQDAAPPLQSHKLAVRDEYLFMILQFPMFDRNSRIIRTAEVDFFIGGDRLVTVNADALESLSKVFADFKNSDGDKPTCLATDVPQLMYLILDDLTASVLPMLRHMAADVEDIEKQLFEKFERNLIKELLRVKTNIVNVRKAMQGHKAVIRKLIEQAQPRYPSIVRLEEYFDQLISNTKDIWDALELQKDTINALHETNESLLDHQTNEIMKTLTIISVITFPLTLFATLFSTRVSGVPLTDNPFGFVILVSSLAVCAAAMLWFFKKKGWI